MQVKYLMLFRKNRLTSDEKSSIWKYERDRKTRRTDFPSRIGPPLRGGNRPGIGNNDRRTHESLGNSESSKSAHLEEER